MATDGPVSRFNGVEYAGADERLLHAALLQRVGSPAFSARTGRRPGGAAPTVSSLTVTVPADSGVIYDSSLGSGPWLWALPSSKAVTLDERPGAGTSRIDVIVARINDVEGARELKIEAVKGEESGSPSKPDLPPLSCEIAAATVPASGAVTLVASTTRTVAAGGILPVATTTERNALPAPHVGLTVYNEQTKALESFDGTSWATSEWQSWSPTLSNIGTGRTFAGRHEVRGSTVRGKFLLTTSVNGISGTAQISLPHAPHASYADGEIAIGTAELRDASAGSPSRTVAAIAVAGSNMYFVAAVPGAGTVTGGTPWTWANGDTIGGTFEYEKA